MSTVTKVREVDTEYIEDVLGLAATFLDRLEGLAKAHNQERKAKLLTHSPSMGPAAEKAALDARILTDRFRDEAMKAGLKLQQALEMDADAFVDFWVSAGKRRRALVDSLAKQGEALFGSSTPTDVKAALLHLCQSGFKLIDATK